MNVEKVNADAARFMDKWAVDKAIDAERAERQAAEDAAWQAKPTYEKAFDTVTDAVSSYDWSGFGDNVRSAMGSTYGPGSEDMNPTTYRPWGKVEDIAQDFGNAVGTFRDNYSAMMNEQGNLQRAMMEAQTTGDYSALENEVDVMRQKGQATTKAMADIAASPFRQAARNFIKNHADDPTSPWQSEAQSLQKTDVNLEYFMTDEEKLQKSREIEAALNLPAASTLASNEAYKAALDMYNLKQKHDSIEEVWEEYPELKTIASTDKEGAAILLHNIGTVKETHGIVDSFFTFLERSNKELELNKIQYKMAYGAASEEEIKRAEELKRQIETDKTKKPAFFQEPFAAMAAGVGESTPQMIDMAIGTGEGAAVGAAATAGTALTLASIAAAVMSGGSSLLVEGGIAGTRALIMRALASQAGRNMIKKGALAGAANSMYEPGVGRRFAENKEMKKKDGTDLYSDFEARQWARLGSAGETFLEIYPTFAVASKALPVAAQVFAQTTDSIIKRELGRETIKDFTTDFMGNILKISATESGEEALQSVSDDIVHNLSLASKGEEAAHYQKYGVGEIMTRAGNAFVESIPATLGFGLIFGGVGGAFGVGRIARSRKQAAEMESKYGQQQAQTMMGAMMVEQLQHAVKGGNMTKIAPDVQQKVIREQLNGTGFENAYIDVEMAMQKGTGREDLKKIADAKGMTADELEAAISVNGYIDVPTEVLAQVETTPEILDSVSFDPEAESMARMRENGKKIVADYEKKYQKMLDNTMKKVDTIADNYIPKATQEQKEALKAAFICNPQNPAQGWNELYKKINGELQEKIGPALEALKKGMGNAGLMEVQDEQGNAKTQRYTENDEWYRNFYKVHKRKPTQAELEDMAIAMTIGDPTAPKVAGWVVDSAEMQQAMERDKPLIESLKNQRDTLNSIKGEAKKMTGVEMELTEGLSPEAFKVYRAISSWAEKAGGKIARAGRMTALLWARHADIVADIISKRTGQKYTAEDYIRQRVGFQLVQNGQGVENVLNQTNGELAAEKLKRDTKAWKKTLSEAWDQNANSDHKLHVMDTPLVLQMIGLQNLPMRINASKIQQIKKDHPEMTQEVWGNLPAALTDPMFIFGSKTVPGRYVIGLELKDTEKDNVIVPVEINAKDGILDINLIVSAYGKDADVNWFWQQMREQTTYYAHKKKTADFYLSAGLQLPLDDRKFRDLFGNSIKTDTDLVKIKNENPRLYQMAGVRATNAPLEALERAKSMEGTPEEIYKATGWLKGADGKWRFEIPDNLEAIDFSKVDEYGDGTLGTIYDNPQLFEAYPNLRYVPVSVKDNMGEVHGRAILNKLTGQSRIEISEDLPDIEKATTLVHEVQHLIQKEENFAAGGSDSTVRERLLDRVEQLNEKIDAEKDQDKIKSLTAERDKIQKALDKYDDYRLYRMLGGEEEARTTEYLAKERADTFAEAKEAEEKYESLKAKASPEQKEMLAEYEKLYFVEDMSDEEESRFIELANKIDDDLTQAFAANDWYKDTVAEMEGGLHRDMPKPHDSYALIVFDGVEHEARQAGENPVDRLQSTDERAANDVINDTMLKLFQRAWHGTPWDFEKFDLGAIGTGEGAQAHGWGLYFAKNREVSQRYKEVLSAGKSDIKIMFGDRRLPAFGFVDGLTEAENKAYRAIQSVNYNKDKAIALLNDIGEKEAADVVEKAEVSYKENQGKLFEVEIPDDDVLLDEQKPFYEQPKKVQTAIRRMITEMKGEGAEKYIKEVEKKHGKEIAEAVRQIIEEDYKTEKEVPVNWNPIDALLKAAETNEKSPQEKIQGLPDGQDILQRADRIRKGRVRSRQRKEYLDNLINIYGDSGRMFYKELSRFLWDDKAASKILNEYGVKGVTYEGGTDGRCFVVFDDKAVDIIEKYNQEVNSQQGQMLGGIDINPGRDGRRIIHLMETANESTFMHEMAHMFLFDLEELAEIDDVSKTELDIVNDWAAWHKGAAEEYKGTAWEQEFSRREQAIIDAEEHGDYDRAEKLKAEWRQERFARGFEIYMRQGKAPAKGLKAVFRKFKDFLRAIYKQFVSDGGKPTEAVRRVMDRMIATEEEIDAAALDDRYNDTLAAGGAKLFTENEEETLKRWHEEEREAAKEKVLKLVMKDLEAARQKEFDNRMEDERERYTKQLQQENIFLARMAYEESKDKENVKIWFDTIEEFDALDEITPPMESLVADHMQEYAETLDRSMMESHLSKEEIDKAMDSSKYRVKIEEYIARGMERKKALINKINAKARAAMDSIEDKLNALPEDVDIQLERNDNDTVKAIMKEITKLRFADKWSTADINHIEAMMRASTQEDVRKAIKELKNRQAEERQNLADVESATKGMEDFFKDLVQQTTATKPMTETCNVNYYLQKERNADRRVKAMIRAKNWDGAISQQRHKVFYTMMVKQARENKEARDKMVADLQRKMNARTVRLPKDERYWFNRILYLMRIGHTDPKVPEGGVADLEDIFKEQQACLDIFFVPDTLTSIVQEGDNFGDYNKLSLARFTATYEDLKRLYTVGRDKFNLKTIAGVTIEEAVLEIMNDPTANNDIATVIRKINPDTGGLNYIDSLGKLGETGDRAAKGVQQYINSGLKVENIIKMLGESAHKYFYKTLEKAAEKEAAMTEKNLKELRDICAMYSNAERREWTDKKYDFSSERGEKISKENIFAMALNWGTESNRQRLCGGLIEDGKIVGDKSAEQVKQEIEDLFQQTMTEKDWKFIQRLWDLVGSYWHDTAEVEEKLNGVALGRVPNLHFEIKTADGATARLRGGYMHIKYNFEKSSRAEEMEMEDMLTSMQAGARRLGAGRGMTKERSENPIYRTLQLDFTVIENHLQDVIHNISFRVPLRDVYRLLHYKNFKTGASLEEHLRRTLGVEAYRELDNWALDAWKTVTDERNSAAGILQKMCRIWRSSSVFNIMAYNIWPVVENLSNVAVASAELGGLKTMAAVGEFYLNPTENFDFVRSMSAFMRTRMDNLDRDLRSQPGTLHAENIVIETIKEHGYDLMVWSDLMCSAPVWLQAYKDAFQPKIEEVKKENEINMQKRLDLAAKVDEIKGQIGEAEKAAAAIDEHLHTRRYGRPEEIEALRGTEYAGRSEGELRAQWGEHKKQSRELGKDLFRAEQDLEQAMKLPVYDDAEMLEEAKHRAVFAADAAIRNTFGSGRNIDLPSVQRSKNELVRMFTAFYGFFNTQYNALYMSYMNSKYSTNGGITKWAPFAREVFYRVALASFIGSALAFGLGLQGDGKDDKEKTITGPDGKKTKIEIPAYERFLKVWGKNALSISWGGLYGIRDIGQVFADMYFTGNNFGYKMGSVASRSITEGIKVVQLITRKDAKDEEIKAQQEKKEREHQEKLKKLKGKKRQEYLKKWEEEQKYKKPPKRITYPEIAGHAAKSIGGVVGAPYGINATMTNAVLSTMDYLLDKDMRYDPTFKNIIWSAVFNKRPVEREIPKKPPAEPKKSKKKKKEKN